MLPKSAPRFRAAHVLIIALAVIGFGVHKTQAQIVVADSCNVTGSGTGFVLNSGVNSGINPPSTRLTGLAAANLRYINTGSRADDAYSISGSKIQITSATNAGRFVLSADGATSFDFATALGIPAASPTNPVTYDISIRIDNSSDSNQRCSLALSTAEGDVDTWDFGIQIYRQSASDNFYTIGKRMDTGSTGLGSDLNEPITTLTGNTFGNEVILLMRVTDAGYETTGFNSRMRLSLNGGNSWFYDTETDTDLTNGWRLNGPGRHFIWHIAGTGGPITFDSFTLRLNPPANNLNTSSVFRVMTYNMHYGAHNGKVNTQTTANYILDQRVDLVVLNEVDRFKTRSDNRDLISELAKETGMSFVYSNNISSSSNDQMGNAILSKYPILFRDHRLLPRVGDNEQRGWLKAIVDVNGRFLSFWGTHLDFHDDDRERLMCVTNLNAWIADEDFPVIVCGDFNDTPGNVFHDRMESKWQDIWELAGDGTLGRTVPCPGPTAARIDYIWKSKGTHLTASNAYVGALENSDHYPVLSQFVFNIFTNHVDSFYFPLNEGSGTKVTDASGKLSGTFDVNAPVWSTSSPSKTAGDFSLYFDGTKRVTVSDSKQIIGTNGINDDYTLQAWVKVAVDYAPAERAILFQYERSPGFSISINTNRTLHTTAFQRKDIASTATLPNDGQWHHVAVVHTDGANMKFYIDSTLASTVSYKNGAGYRVSPAITLGAEADGIHPFTGYLDRVRFDNRALTPAEFDFFSVSNSPPVASNMTVTVVGDFPARLMIPASDPDGDSLSFQIQGAPSEGLITGFSATNGFIDYVPARGFRGQDRILFIANDGTTNSAIGTITLNVQAPADSNSNGLPDAWEVRYNVTNPGADADGDGQSNLAEYLANTNPTNAASALKVFDANLQTSGRFGLSWSSVGGTRYRILYSSRLFDGETFSELIRPISDEMDSSPVGQSSTQTFVDTLENGGTNTTRFYRIKVVP